MHSSGPFDGQSEAARGTLDNGSWLTEGPVQHDRNCLGVRRQGGGPRPVRAGVRTRRRVEQAVRTVPGLPRHHPAARHEESAAVSDDRLLGHKRPAGADAGRTQGRVL